MYKDAASPLVALVLHLSASRELRTSLIARFLLSISEGEIRVFLWREKRFASLHSPFNASAQDILLSTKLYPEFQVWERNCKKKIPPNLLDRERRFVF